MQRFLQITYTSIMAFAIFFFFGFTVMIQTIAFYSFYNDGLLFGKVNTFSVHSSLVIGTFAAIKYGIETWHKTKKKKFWKND